MFICGKAASIHESKQHSSTRFKMNPQIFYLFQVSTVSTKSGHCCKNTTDLYVSEWPCCGREYLEILKATRNYEFAHRRRCLSLIVHQFSKSNQRRNQSFKFFENTRNFFLFTQKNFFYPKILKRKKNKNQRNE